MKELHDLLCAGRGDGHMGATAAPLAWTFCFGISNLSTAQQARIHGASGVAALSLAGAYHVRHAHLLYVIDNDYAKTALSGPVIKSAHSHGARQNL